MYSFARKPPKEVYRYMNNEQFFENFLDGKIRISTLKACREYENQEMGDKDEAKEFYKITNAIEDEDPNFHTKMNRLGISYAGSSGGIAINCTSEQQLPNSFLLCTTNLRNDEKFSKDFGRFCLKIRDSERFFQLVSRAIHKEYKLLGGLHEKVSYKPQHYLDDELPPGKIGFVKRLRYAWQEEYRFLWLAENWDIGDYLDIDVPEIKYLCERVL